MTSGFEFSHMLDGSAGTPAILTFTLGAAAAHKAGDAMLMQSDGYIDQVTGTTTEVTCIMQESLAAAAVTAGSTQARAAVVNSHQVWRCSMDASSTAAVAFYTKTLDTADCRTLDADDTTNGRCMVVGFDGVDSAGNVIALVTFRVPTVGNALS